jgi:hypothetical protein
MWSDNETTIDLLGFDALADELEVLLTDEDLLPLTVLVDGEWGSGKSSLMKVMKERLEADHSGGDFIVVEFSPWRFEDFEFAKVALMAAVVDAIGDYIGDVTDEHVRESLLKKLNKVRLVLGKFGVFKAAAVVGMAHFGAAAPVLALGSAVADVVGNVGGDTAGATQEAGAKEDSGPQREFESVSDFHVVFEELIDGLGDGFRALVVFIDDMDRCSNTETVVEMFETMRLFLRAPKTAYVVGAQSMSVERALNRGYLGRTEDDDRAGGEWLEKMLQQRIIIPPLGEPDVVTYINMLFCQLQLPDTEKFDELRGLVDERRRQNPFGTSFHREMLAEVLDTLPEGLTEQLDIADQIGPVLAQGLRGNPRQTKGFLNDLLRRLATARRRGMDIDAEKLAKLMVLEQPRHKSQYETLFTWFLDADSGAPEQLTQAEAYAREENADACPKDVRAWAEMPGVSQWLLIKPDLAGVNLGPYFTFSRGRLADLITAPQLSFELQLILDALGSSTEFRRRGGVRQADELSAESFNQLLPRLVNSMAKDTSGGAAQSLVELAPKRAAAADAMFDRLASLPDNRISDIFMNNLVAAMSRDSRTRTFLDRCVKVDRLSRAATRALSKLKET